VLYVGCGQYQSNVALATLHGDVLSSLRLSASREQWLDKISDLVGGVPVMLPPFREVNHEINLINPNKRITYQLPKCPDALKAELAEKISWYTSVGWWVPATA